MTRYFYVYMLMEMTIGLATPALAQQSVCARVRLRIEQEAVVTRTAFLATLKVTNDAGDPLTQIVVSLDIRDAAGTWANDRFGIPEATVENMSDVNGGGVILPNTTATAKWLITPNEDAGTTADPSKYTVGGSLQYMQEGHLVSVTLYPTPITVYPDAKLFAKYFWQRDVYSDNPFTAQVEPSEPFSLGLIMFNAGLGPAKNLQITSNQPEIIENEKDLLIAFKMIGAQVGTQAIAPSLTVNLGDIMPGKAAVCRWLMTSTLQGRFCAYMARFEHTTNLGDPRLTEMDPRLSILKNVEVYELAHVVRLDKPGDDGLPDFLVTCQKEAKPKGSECALECSQGDLPTTIHVSDGSIVAVRAIVDATVDGPPTAQDLNVTLTANLAAGWNYIRIDDPSAHKYRLAQVVRSDGRVILMPDNAWDTHRWKPVDGPPTGREDRVHIVDYGDDASTATYTLMYTANPADLNRDGTVDATDFGLFRGAFGRKSGDVLFNPDADYDHDNAITLVDYQSWLWYYRDFVNNPLAAAPGSTVQPDLDGDGDVDLADFLAFQGCFNGPNRPAQSGTDCGDADFDQDKDVDLADFLAFQGCYNGPNRPPAAGCE